MKYSLVFSSNSGNTKKLADVIYQVLGKENFLYFGDVTSLVFNEDILFVGFWTNMGTSNEEIKKYLKTLRNKKIFLFGTAGFLNNEYEVKIIESVKTYIDPSNTIIGEFMSQGAMGDSVLSRYKLMEQKEGLTPKLQMLIDNFYEAKKHPSLEDLETLKDIVIKLK